MSKAVWDDVARIWKISGTLCPNWTPDEVSFRTKSGVNCVITNKEWLDRALKLTNKKKSENMLDEDQKKVVIGQLRKRYKELDDCIESWTGQVAVIGNRLHIALKERDAIDEVLANLNPCDECNNAH